MRQSPLSAHQSLAVRSVLAVASSWPSGEKQSHITWSEWPSNNCRRSPWGLRALKAQIGVHLYVVQCHVCMCAYGHETSISRVSFIMT